MLIDIKDVSFTYFKGTAFARNGLTDVNLQIDQGQWVVIMGPTGSGKSTLLQHLNGLLKPNKGQVLLDNKDIHSSSSAIREARRKVGLVFQYPEHQLFGSSVFEEVVYGPDNFSFSKPDMEETVDTSLKSVGLDPQKFKDRQPHSLSGGEKRRVALASVLAVRPKVLALDEPTAGLDWQGRQLLIKTIYKLNREKGITVIWVTHEVSEITAIAHRLVILNKGHIVADGSIRELLNQPLLAELDLDIPLPVTVAGLLEKQGKSVEGNPVSIEEIKTEILRVVR
jgi:energy-coupling factor transport system ATP-binding protein